MSSEEEKKSNDFMILWETQHYCINNNKKKNINNNPTTFAHKSYKSSNFHPCFHVSNSSMPLSKIVYLDICNDKSIDKSKRISHRQDRLLERTYDDDPIHIHLFIYNISLSGVVVIKPQSTKDFIEVSTVFTLPRRSFYNQVCLLSIPRRMAPQASKELLQRQHGVKGVYYGGKWVNLESCRDKSDDVDDIEDFLCSNHQNKSCRLYNEPCPRSRSRVRASSNEQYDVVIIGAGCIGAAIARELSRYKLSVLWLEVSFIVFYLLSLKNYY